MPKEAKSLRLSTSLIEKIEEHRQKETKRRDIEISFNAMVEELLGEKFKFTDRNLIMIGDRNFFPVHLNNSELSSLMLDVFDFFSTEKDYCRILVRKNHGGKGVEFMITTLSHDFKAGFYPERRYSFTINPNWQVIDIFDHYSSGFTLKTERVNYECLPNLPKIIQERLIKDHTPELNPLFNDYEWKVVFESAQAYYLLNDRVIKQEEMKELAPMDDYRNSILIEKNKRSSLEFRLQCAHFTKMEFIKAGLKLEDIEPMFNELEKMWLENVKNETEAKITNLF